MRSRLLIATALAAVVLSPVAVTAPASAAPPPAAATTAEPQPPLGTVTDFGVQAAGLTVLEAFYGTDGDGRPTVYTVQTGTPGVLGVVDPVSRQWIRTVPMPGSGGAWGITQAPDGSVYAGSYNNAHLYRFDPRTGEAVDLGAPVPGELQLYGLQAAPDGRIYGGTYPHAHAWTYSPADGFRDLGPMFEGQHYSIDIAVDPARDVLWAAIGSAGHLIRYDMRTGEKRDIWPEALRGDSSHPADINLVGGRLFVKRSKLQALVLDPDTGQVIHDGFTMSSRGTSRLAPDGRSVYFTSGTQLWRYDLTTDTLGPVQDASGATVITGGAGVGWGFIDGAVHAAIGNYAGDAFRFDLTTRTSERFKLPFPPQPLGIGRIAVGPDGRLYTNAYINGTLSVLDPATGAIAQLGRVGQADGWFWHNGLAYIGVYPSGSVHRYDAAKPFVAGTNPKELFRLSGHGQNRPVAFVDTDTSLFVGSTPDYGQWGGALTQYDLATGTHKVKRNIVPDQGIIALTMHNGKIWGGTSINGGGGTTPKATEAKLFVADPVTGEKIAEYTPVPGAQDIAAVRTGPDGLLWGMANTELFIFDPATETVVYRATLPGEYSGVQDELYIGPDEHVYASIDGQLLRFDPLSRQMTVLRQSSTYLLTPGPDGSFWFRSGVKLPNRSVIEDTRLLKYTPPPDACTGSDLRSTVFAGNRDSGVANRYRADGCTVNDLIRDDQPWKDHGEFVAHVAQVTEQLVSDRIITTAEKDAIVAAAGRSRIGG